MSLNANPSLPRLQAPARRLAVLALASGLLLAPAWADPGPADAQEDSTSGPNFDRSTRTTRVYHAEHIDAHDAVMLAHQACLAELHEAECQYSVQLPRHLPTVSPRWFSYTTQPFMQEKIAGILAAADVPIPSLDLRVVLLLAGPDAAAPPALPEAEARALADVQQILPYKGYQLLESGLVRTRDRANLRLGHDPAYEAQIELERPADLRQDSIQVRRFELVRHGVRQVRREAAPEGGVPGAEWERISEEIMATRFAMEAGETVVVGTSRLNGDDRALIVLLTAER